MTQQEFVGRVFAGSTLLTPPHAVAYGEKVSDHLSVGVDQLASADTGTMTLLPQTVELFEKARKILDRPIRVNAGFRTVTHELELQNAGYRTAKWISPHCLGAALDLQIPATGVTSMEVNGQLQRALKQAATELGWPVPRLGHWAYGEHFTHVDLVFMIFRPWGEVPHPKDWPELDPEIAGNLGASWVPGISW
jgi:hypothetical protein